MALLGRGQFRPLESGFEDIEKLLLLLMDGLSRIEFALQGKAGYRLSEAQKSLATGQLYQFDLNIGAISHEPIVIRTRRIATFGRGSPATLGRTVRAPGNLHVRNRLR